MGPLEPQTVGELADIVRDANAARRPLLPVGGRTRLTTVPPSAAAAALLSTTGLRGELDHGAGDLVATIPAGMTLDAANRLLSRQGQQLPIDPPFGERATIGGIVAGNESGPRRHRYGAPRDLIIGISMVLADGRTAKAGGRVVKNVAGYDLARLMCGSFGSLAVITSATFKLSPTAAASRTVRIDFGDGPRLGHLVQALVNAPLTPSAVDVAGPPFRLLVRFETTRTAADHMSGAAAAIGHAHGGDTTILESEDEAESWASAQRDVWEQSGAIVKVAVLPTDMPYILATVAAASTVHRLSWSISGRAALGVFFVRVDGPAQLVASLIAELRHRATVTGGSLVVQRTAPGLEHVSVWGDPLPAAGLMRAVKKQFDPNGILSPGIGPGGL